MRRLQRHYLHGAPYLLRQGRPRQRLRKMKLLHLLRLVGLFHRRLVRLRRRRPKSRRRKKRLCHHDSSLPYMCRKRVRRKSCLLRRLVVRQCSPRGKRPFLFRLRLLRPP